MPERLSRTSAIYGTKEVGEGEKGTKKDETPIQGPKGKGGGGSTLKAAGTAGEKEKTKRARR